ncbi:Ribosomal lysine N-methyltransferase set10 [Trametes pubescens]|uniref:Ribosomal lysine N-methyltransferase set10 n=1 Tax=Trametes pubescens TaxID=154538 RepID=A0A1M2VTK9_TRAPU|nr:Ribosomal lysine N-methyltransferase set10 [Trametes pubescens]
MAANDISADVTVVSIPFSLAVTPDGAKKALQETLKGFDDVTAGALDSFSERQLVCTYLCLHWIADRSRTVLRHGPYLDTLPSPERLMTPLHFTPNELEAFKGSNLYGATLDRRRDWEAEWAQCRDVVAAANPTWGEAFTWDRYLTTSTYLSSRAFPSTVLSSTPTLHTTPSSYPVFLPGIDALNHARAHPVSWVVSDRTSTSISTSASPEPSISLVIHTPTGAGSELLNNYGPKPNAEFILGYGFSLPNNPDDTIVLKIGGPSGASAPVPADVKFEVGRNARGAEPVWDAVLAAIGAQYGDEEEDSAMETETSVEDELCAADMLAEMAQNLYDRLPPFPPANVAELRGQVVDMLDHYLEGQRDILRSLVAFAQEKEARALQRAKEEGLDVVEEGEEEEEMEE